MIFQKEFLFLIITSKSEKFNGFQAFAPSGIPRKANEKVEMKKGALPDAYKKRKLLNDTRPAPERLIALGEVHLEQGLLYDAAEFFLKASHEEGLARIRALAVEAGDSFLYSIALSGTDGEGDARGWEELGRKAMELKKYTYALRAFQKAGNDSLKAQAEEALKGLNNNKET